MWIDNDDGVYDYTHRVHGFWDERGVSYLGFECDNQDKIISLSGMIAGDLYDLLNEYWDVWRDKTWKEAYKPAREVFKMFYFHGSVDEIRGYLTTLRELEEAKDD